MIKNSFLSKIITLLLVFFSIQAIGQEGEALFQANCASCHAIGKKVIGPDLSGVTERRPEEWLLKFISNSQEVINGGDEYAQNLFKEYNQVIMPPMPLDDGEIKSILQYVEEKAAAMQASANQPAGAGVNGGMQQGSGSGNTFLNMDYGTSIIVLVLVTLVLLIIIGVLLKIKGQLTKMEWDREHPGQPYPESRMSKAGREIIYPVKDFVLHQLNPTIGVLTIIGVFVVLLAFNLYNRAQDLGTQIGYAPEQPVKFSHRLHAGQYQIDCQYCHTGVEKSKNANIPSPNICMNCHNYISEGPKFGNEEIAKVVAAYENNEPIEWVRIHNLPDHVYFSHQQHVSVGQVECQTCHGEIQEMEVVHQNSKLEMGWCINCHRETEVDLGNGYYKETFDFVKEHDKYTVSDFGGTDCSKCHY